MKRRGTTPGTLTKRWATSIDESDHTEATMAHVSSSQLQPAQSRTTITNTMTSNGDDDDVYDAGSHRVNERDRPHRSRSK